MLSKEQIALLYWIAAQPEPPCKMQMEEEPPPGYDDVRLEALVRDGYLGRQPGHLYRGHVVAKYFLTDKALAELQKRENNQSDRAKQQAKEISSEAKRMQERMEDRADEERRYRGQNKVTIIASLLSFFLGLLVEHLAGFLDFILGVFR